MFKNVVARDDLPSQPNTIPRAGNAMHMPDGDPVMADAAAARASRWFLTDARLLALVRLRLQARRVISSACEDFELMAISLSC